MICCLTFYLNNVHRETVKDDDEDDNKIEKLSMKKKGVGSELRAERMVNTDVDLQLLGHAEQERQMIKQKKRRLGGREEEVCFYCLFICIILQN